LSPIRKFAIQHPYDGVAEDESCARIIRAAAMMGVEAKAFKNSHDIIGFAPDFVLSLTHQDPKLTPFPTYGVLTAPTRWYETPRFIRNILTYDGYLTVTPGTEEWLGDLTFGARKTNTPVGFYANTVLSLESESTLDFSNANLAYVGTNWDGSRHNALFTELRKEPFMHFYGPEASWNGYGHSYKGSLPFDGDSLLQALRNAGVGLCIEHPDFQSEGIPTNRIFETIASGAVAICSRSAFNKRWFGDNVLYVDIDESPAKVSAQIKAHVSWVRTHADEAAVMAANAQAAYRENLSPEKMLENLFTYHEENLIRKNYVAPVNADVKEPKVGVIMRAGGRSENYLRRAIGSIARQSHKNITLFLILWDTPPGLDDVLASCPELDIVCKHLPGGGRSDCLWAGLQSAKQSGCDFIGMLDDDDEYHINMVASLVACYKYHTGLSLPMPVAMVTGGSLKAYEKPVKLPFDDIQDGSRLLRAETRYIQQFHFGSGGQVNDRSFTASSTAMLVVADFLDPEILQNPRLEIAEDYYLWLQLAERGRTAFCPEIVATVHNHDDGQSDYSEASPYNVAQHARIGRRMLGRRFNAVEDYHSQLGLTNKECYHVRATHTFDNTSGHGEQAQTSYSTSPFVLNSEGLKAEREWLPTGQYHIEYAVAANFPFAANGTQLLVTTKLRHYLVSLTLEKPDDDSEMIILTGTFDVSIVEENTGITFTLLGDAASLDTAVDGCQITPARADNRASAVELSQYGRVWLFGASNQGALVFDLLNQQGVAITGVADTYKRGAWQDFEILSPDALAQNLHKDDTVLIASVYWKEIGLSLRQLNVWNDLLWIKDPMSIRDTLTMEKFL